MYAKAFIDALHAGFGIDAFKPSGGDVFCDNDQHL
jgi:hypothetical protein